MINRKSEKQLFGVLISISIIFALVATLTYAYFYIDVETRNQHNEVVTTGTLELTYVDGTQIIVENMEPGWQATKTLTIENTGSFSTYYSINWSNINNTIERNELVMSSTCTGTNCKAMEEEAIGNTLGPFIKGIKIEPGVTHTYTFTFEFIETGSEQNYNQSKVFSGVLNVAQSTETFTLKGMLLDSSDNPVSNAQITLDLESQTTTDTDGKFTFENVEVGNHTIEAVNESSEEILDDEISFNSGESLNVSGTTMTKDNSQNEVNVIIKLGGFNNINSIISGYTLLDKMNVALAHSDESIDFSKTNDGIGCNYNDSTRKCDTFGTEIVNSNGQGLYYRSDLTKTENGERVYYYRGVVENNYVVFAGFCWRIVRTNEDGSIKLRYGGVPIGTSGNYTCPQTGTNVGINNQTEVLFNQTYGDNTYVGYMMGLENQCSNTTHCIGNTHSTALNAQANTYDSNIKSVIDAWYRDNIASQGTSVTSKIVNSIYCNDRSIGSSGITISYQSINYTFTANAYGQNPVLYGSLIRLGLNGSAISSINSTPQYKCPNLTRDGFTLSVANGGTSDYGNNKLTYPVGLLTPDEAAYAGGVIFQNNSTYYLYTGNYYWTMGPFWSIARSDVFNFSNVGSIERSHTYGPYFVAPVISLNTIAFVSTGTGEYNSPYEIE